MMLVSHKEVKRLRFHFVCFFVSRIMEELLNLFSKNNGGKVAHRPRKNPLAFGGNKDHVRRGMVRVG